MNYIPFNLQEPMGYGFSDQFVIHFLKDFKHLVIVG